jgi:hypothetical protein
MYNKRDEFIEKMNYTLNEIAETVSNSPRQAPKFLLLSIKSLYNIQYSIYLTNITIIKINNKQPLLCC